MYLRGLGFQFQLADGSLINSPLSVDSVPVLDWRKLPADLDRHSVRDSGGRLVAVTSLLGGWLIDGCPLNVVYGEGWITGQQEALKAAGYTRCLPDSGETTPGGGKPVVKMTMTPAAAITPSGFNTGSLPGSGAPPIVWDETPPDSGPAAGAGFDVQSILPYAALGIVGLLMMRGGRR